MLLIVVQFASVAAMAHGGHGHDGHGVQAHAVHIHGTAAGAAVSLASDDTGPANRIAPPADRIQPAAHAAASVQNARGAAADSATCVTGCCGTGMGCCGAALAAVSPNLPPKACSPRIGFASPVSVREVDPRGLRKPPRFPA
jgi:hypothetical protein